MHSKSLRFDDATWREHRSEVKDCVPPPLLHEMQMWWLKRLCAIHEVSKSRPSLSLMPCISKVGNLCHGPRLETDRPEETISSLRKSFRPCSFFQMSDHGRLPDGSSPIEGLSPTDSCSTLFSKSESPTEKLINHSPRSLNAKPWPARPQRLYKGIGGWRWWDSAVDLVMIMIPIPFFILAAAVVAVNGKVVDERELSILDQSIKGVTKLCISFNCWAPIDLNYLRLPPCFQSASQLSLEEQL